MEVLPRSRSDLVRLVQQISFFHNLSTDVLDPLIEEGSSFLRFMPDEWIIREGQSDDSALYILLVGRLAVCVGEKNHILEEIRMGEFFGEISFATKNPRLASVKALAPSILWRLDAQVMGRIPIELREKIKDHIIVKLARVIQLNNEQLLAHLP